MADIKKKGFSEGLLEGTPSEALDDAMLSECETRFNEGKYDEAVKCCADLKKKKSSMILIYYYEGMSFYNKGKLDEALSSLEEGLKKNPKFWLLHSARGLVLYSQGKYKEALDSLNKSMETKEDVSTMVLAGICATIVKDLKQTEKHLKKAVNLNYKVAFELFDTYVVAVLESGTLPKDAQKELEKQRSKIIEMETKLDDLRKKRGEVKKK